MWKTVWVERKGEQRRGNGQKKHKTADEKEKVRDKEIPPLMEKRHRQAHSLKWFDGMTVRSVCVCVCLHVKLNLDYISLFVTAVWCYTG